MNRVLQPQGWPRPKGYANGIAAEGRMVFTSGIVGWDQAGNFPAGFLPQVRQALMNVRGILAEAEAGPKDLVRLTWYVVDVEMYLSSPKELGRIYRACLGDHFPAMAVVEVRRLVEKQALLEIEATAVVDDRAGGLG
jgi:enamine deaminase RidA (YjgF/YER057c/UK114 family)